MHMKGVHPKPSLLATHALLLQLGLGQGGLVFMNVL